MIRGLPERLKENRKRYGYSQKQVAAKLGLSPSIVSGYETGERTPSTDVLLSLSYLYHCSLDYLVGKQTQEQPCVLDTSGLTDKQIVALNLLIAAFKEQ